MKATIVTPTLAEIEFLNSKEEEVVAKLSTYKNKSISYQLNLHKKKTWLQNKDPDGYAEQLKFLQSKEWNSLLEQNNTKFSVKPGFLPYLNTKVDIQTKNLIDYPEPKPIPWKSVPEFEPYFYQSESVKKLMQVKHGNISLPTGCGKSFILLLIARTMGLRTVVVTPSASIFNELLDEFTERLGKQYVGGYGDGKKDTSKLITIAIGKSITMLKEGSQAMEFFQGKQLMLVDESHTFAAAELEKACHGVLKDVPYRMFVSATQTRTDGTEKMLYSIIGENVFEMGLKEAIDGGYLCPLKFFIVNTFSPSTKYITDSIACKREHFLYNTNIADYASKIAYSSYKSLGESTLILVDELVQIDMLQRRLKKLGVPYTYAHSASKKIAESNGLQTVNNKEEVLRFNRGEVAVLIGTSCISTGTNIYPTHNTVNWVGGSSEIATKQGAMGRSTRILEKSKFAEFHKPKPFTKIWDFSIRGQKILENQLKSRIKYYNESGGEIKHCN